MAPLGPSYAPCWNVSIAFDPTIPQGEASLHEESGQPLLRQRVAISQNQSDYKLMCELVWNVLKSSEKQEPYF